MAAVFSDEKQVEKFLKDHFVVIDDCPATGLDIEIKKIGGTSCKNTRYTIKPIQNTGCAPGTQGEFNITHINPLDGTSEEVTVHLDESPPSITCGFYPDPHVKKNNSVSADGKTLYHRLENSVGSRLKLHNADFFYTVNVSTHGSIRLCYSASTSFYRLNIAFIVCLQQDNCGEADVQINAKLETNELHQSKIAEMIEYNNANSSRQFELVYKDYR